MPTGRQHSVADDDCEPLHYPQSLFDFGNHVVGSPLQVALPDYEGFPSQYSQCIKISFVAFYRCTELSQPEVGARGRRSGIPAPFVTVPVTPMNQDRGSVLFHNDVGCTWKGSVMQPEPEPRTVKH